MQVNFGSVAKSYALYRNDIPRELIESLKIRGINFSKKNVVDLGAGTGALSRLLAQEGACVVGVEPSIELIEQAKVFDEKNGINIKYINNYSESTGLEEGKFDIVTVMRAWHWFDRNKVLLEIKRALKEKGFLIIMDSGFTSKNEVVVDTLDLIKSHMPNGELKSAGSKAEAKQIINSFPIDWFQEWKEQDFDLRETYKFEYTVSFTNEEWCGRVASLSWLSGFSEEKRSDILDELYKYLLKNYHDYYHQIEHGCYVTILKRI